MGHKEWLIIQIKRLRFVFFLPIFVMYFIQPAYLFLTRMVGYGGFGREYVKDAIIGEVYYLYPVLSLVWSYWILSRYIEDEDRELSYLYNKIKLKEVCSMCVIYLMLCFFPLVIYVHWLGIRDVIYLYMTVSSVVILYNALMYYGCYLFNSSVIVMLLFVVYSLFVASPGNGIRYRWYYVKLFTADRDAGLFNAFILLMFSCILFTVGRAKNRVYTNYG